MKYRETKTVKTSIVITRSQKEKLVHLAEQLGTTANDVVCRLIENAEICNTVGVDATAKIQARGGI